MDNRYIDWFLIALSCFLLFFYLPIELGSDNHENLFLRYVEKYNKSYAKGSEKYAERMTIFQVRIKWTEYINISKYVVCDWCEQLMGEVMHTTFMLVLAALMGMFSYSW